MSSEIRKDYFLNRYVIITPSRFKRPRSTITRTFFVKEKECPFCPENIEKNLIIKPYFRDTLQAGGLPGRRQKAKTWQIMVLENKFPVVSLKSIKAFGQNEVVVETPRHNKDLSESSIEEIMNLLYVFEERTRELSKIKKIEYILIFKNEGGKAGASLVHAHSQVFALGILPPDVEEEISLAYKYKIVNGSCPYCDIIKKEEHSPRLIFADSKVVAIAPYAPSYHYEAWIFPRRHIDNISCLNKGETRSFAVVMKKILSKITKQNLSYNFFLHQVIKEKDQHFCLKIQPREAVWGGIELGSGLIVNSISPEEAAKFYRSKF